MRSANDSLKIFLAEVALFLVIDEAKEGDTVEVGDVGERLAIGLDGLGE